MLRFNRFVATTILLIHGSTQSSTLLAQTRGAQLNHSSLQENTAPTANLTTGPRNVENKFNRFFNRFGSTQLSTSTNRERPDEKTEIQPGSRPSLQHVFLISDEAQPQVVDSTPRDTDSETKTSATKNVAQEKETKPEDGASAKHVDAKQIPSLTTQQVQDLSPKQVASFFSQLSASQISSLLPWQLQLLSPEQISNQLSELTPEQLGALTPQQVAGVTPQELTGLSPRQMQAILPALPPQLSPTGGQPGKTPPQVITLANGLTLTPQELTPAQIQSLTPAQLQSISPQVLNLLEPQQIQAFTTKQIEGLTSQQVQSLTPQTLNALSPNQVKAFNTQQLQELTQQQVQSFTDDQLVFSSAQVSIIFPLLSPKQIGWLMPWQVTAITPAQLQALTPAQFAGFTSRQIQYLSKSQTQAITPSILSVDKEQIKDFTTKQIGELTQLQLDQLFNHCTNCLTQAQQQSINPLALPGVLSSILQSNGNLSSDPLSGFNTKWLTSAQAAAFGAFLNQAGQSNLQALQQLQLPTLNDKEVSYYEQLWGNSLPAYVPGSKVPPWPGQQNSNSTPSASNDGMILAARPKAPVTRPSEEKTYEVQPGSMLVLHHTDVLLATPQSKVRVAKNTAAFTVRIGTDLAVYNLSGDGQKSVEVSTGGESIAVPIGKVLFISQSGQTLSQSVLSQCIECQNEKSLGTQGHSSLSLADFSYVSALENCPQFQQFVRSQDTTEQKTGTFLLKLAAANQQ